MVIIIPSKDKILTAILLLLSLKGIAKGFIIGSVLTACLFLYAIVADALCEITTHLAALWVQSDSITRFLLLCLAVYVVRRLIPYILLLKKRGVL